MGSLTSTAAIYPHAYRGKLVTTGGSAGQVGMLVWYYRNGTAKSE